MGLKQLLTIAVCVLASLPGFAAADEPKDSTCTQGSTLPYHYYPDPTVVSFKTKTLVTTAVMTVIPGTVTVVQSPNPTDSVLIDKNTGCDSVDNCTGCAPGTSCMIADLPGECIQDSSGLCSLEVSQLGHRRACDQTLLKLNRQERKAWAVSITPRNCLPFHDFDLDGYDRLLYEECAQTIQDLSQEELSSWISGFLPLKCPWVGYNSTTSYVYYTQQSLGGSPTKDHVLFNGQTEEERQSCWDVYEKLVRNLPEHQEWSTTGLCNREGCQQAYASDEGVRPGQDQ